jgi:hypothetical protein
MQHRRMVSALIMPSSGTASQLHERTDLLLQLHGFNGQGVQRANQKIRCQSWLFLAARKSLAWGMGFSASCNIRQARTFTQGPLLNLVEQGLFNLGVETERQLLDLHDSTTRLGNRDADKLNQPKA